MVVCTHRSVGSLIPRRQKSRKNGKKEPTAKVPNPPNANNTHPQLQHGNQSHQTRTDPTGQASPGVVVVTADTAPPPGFQEHLLPGLGNHLSCHETTSGLQNRTRLTSGSPFSSVLFPGLQSSRLLRGLPGTRVSTQAGQTNRWCLSISLWIVWLFLSGHLEFL